MVHARQHSQTSSQNGFSRQITQASPISLENCNEIDTNLFLGGITAALQTQVLVDQGIRAVVCCVREVEFPDCDFHKDLEYYRVDVEDIGREPIELFWPEATEFIHSCITQDKPVLVHCRAGVSRSASTVIAYLVQYQGYSLRDAFLLARAHRPVVTPNLGFMQKLCDFEASERATKPTISFFKYASWYGGSQVAAIPDVGPDEDTDALGMKPAQTCPNFAFSLEDSEGDVQVAQGALADLELETTKAASEVPSDMSFSASSPRVKFKSVVQQVMSKLSEKKLEHKDSILLDLPHDASDDPIVRGRVERIHTILSRYAALDPELGYCQGMHIVAALFAAASNTQGSAHSRFDAFVGGIRGLWLAGFPLLEAGAAQFEELAQHRVWLQHFRTHHVEPSMYLPKAWLALFSSWLPLQTLTESLELLEGHGFAGIVAMTLAMLDHASDRLLCEHSAEGILRLLGSFREHAPDAAELARSMHVWLPIVVQALAASYAKVVSQPSAAKLVDMHCVRDGSRVLVSGEDMDLLNLKDWVRTKKRLPPVVTFDNVDTLFVRQTSSDPGPSPPKITDAESSSVSCWSWCWPSPKVFSNHIRRNSTSALLTRRKSVRLADQKHEISDPERADEIRNDRARERARRFRKCSLAWSGADQDKSNS